MNRAGRERDIAEILHDETLNTAITVSLTVLDCTVDDFVERTLKTRGTWKRKKMYYAYYPGNQFLLYSCWSSWDSTSSGVRSSSCSNRSSSAVFTTM